MLLAVDTSTRTIGLALYQDDQVLGETVWTSQDYHTVELAPAVEDLMKKCGAHMGKLEALGVALGPGSFTGLRIGLALIKGIALARGLPVVGIPTLDVLAAAQPQATEKLAAVLQAGRSRIAVGWYSASPKGWVPSSPVETMTIPELAQKIDGPVWVCGELTEGERRALGRKRKQVHLASPAQSIRRPGFLAELAWRRWQAGKVDNPASLSPIYLHHNEPIPE
jgi:tRNA threonylcarbamoyladenosine biosynthesis protein TsaB